MANKLSLFSQVYNLNRMEEEFVKPKDMDASLLILNSTGFSTKLWEFDGLAEDQI